VAGLGLRGDRYFAKNPGDKKQVTLFSSEIFERLRIELNLPDADAPALRRNLLVGGTDDLNALTDIEFSIQGVRFRGVEECRPCYWMDTALGPGAEQWLKGRGGLRCQILNSGWLRVKPEVSC
jgi:MOSC domain-containing protein YiiM